MTQISLPVREAIALENKWNAESIFPSNAAWEAEFEAVNGLIPQVEHYKGRLAEGATALADMLDTIEKMEQRMWKLFVYAGFSAAVDTNDQQATAMAGRAQGLLAKVSAARAFVEPELIAIGPVTLNGWIKENPQLGKYQHAWDDLFRQQAHVRSAEVEEVLGMVSDPLSTADETASKLTNADLKFPPALDSHGDPQPLAPSTINKLMLSEDREVRRTAWENYADKHLEFKNTLANNLLAAVKRDVFYTRVRGHQSSLDTALFPHNIPTAVFYNLIDTFKSHLPTWHRYWRIRRQALGVETLHPYDIWAPITAQEPTVPYPQAVEWISTALAPLGKDYTEALRRGCLVERWIDLYPNEGKRAGAFSWGVQGTYPFIMMSYTNDLKSMSTLAHELGHSMHSYLTWQHQPYVYTSYSLFAAEVASNFNQAMTRAYLFDHQSERDFQIALIEEAMSNFHRYFFIMPTLARFELALHEREEAGKGTTAEDMIELMADYFSEAYGGEMHVDRARVGITWAQFGHLYANFYVFQYATGISGAHAFAERILSGAANAAHDYVGFLSAGSSGYPLDVLRKAGVDLSTPASVEKTFEVMTQMIDRLESLTTS